MKESKKMEERGMRRKKIAFITSNPNSIYVERLVNGIFSQSRAYGFDVIVLASMVQVCHFLKEYLEGELNIYELVRSPMIDGVIVDTCSLTANQETMVTQKLLQILSERSSIPVISLDMSFGPYEVVHTDDTAAFEKLTRHIIEEHGCRDIGFLSGLEDEDVPNKRLIGFRNAMLACGLPLNEDRIYHGEYWYSYGERIADKVKNGEITLPEAFICSTDYVALGLVNRLKKYGIRVPEDVLVTGYDAIAEAAINDPTITTFIPMCAHTAAEAVNRLATKIAPELGAQPIELFADGNLITCRSCGCVDHKDDIIRQFDLSVMEKNPNFGDENVQNRVDMNRLLGSYMLEQINSSETSDECLWNIYLHAYLLMPYKRFSLCLREDWKDYESIMEKGYPEKMKLVLDAKGENDIFSDTNGVIFDTAELLPGLDEYSDEPAVWYFTPVHHIRNSLGYAVLKRDLNEEKKLDDVFSLWIRNVDNSLEMIRVRNKLLGFSEKDALTGLYNRRGMDRWIREKQRTDADSRLSVLMIDMDGLKHVNDNFGHKEGDFAIRAIASALQSVETEQDIVVRTGGDEFCVLSLSFETVEEKARLIREAIERANLVAEKPYTISASVGFSSGELTSEMLDRLFQDADEMMYSNKKQKKKLQS